MSALRISLRAGERIFVNGAVMRPDRKVTLEFLNTVSFLLEQHVMTPEETTTPLRQLYFMIQTAMIDPNEAGIARAMAAKSIQNMMSVVSTSELRDELFAIGDLLQRQRFFDALRHIRKLFPLEERVMARAILESANDDGAHAPDSMPSAWPTGVVSCK
ncbi:MAG: flagellar biosynthesis repressor FlbT [Hyphomicrobium sp.]|nr:flagellar biosynthesis repressor FlbT [Hyphomicrobium sp.]